MLKPRVSLILLVCNQHEFVAEAARSCLAQQVDEPIEIVLSDDASSDGSFEVLQALAADYRGPHQVRARRNPVNLGIGAHFNVLMAETCGELIVTAAGDDLALPHRVQTLLRAWDDSAQRLDLLASHYRDMAPDGSLGQVMAVDDLAQVGLAQWLQKRPFTHGATHAFTRRLMARFGPFVEDVWYEDLVMMFRAVLSGGAATVSQPLLHYRRSGSSKGPAGLSVRGEDLLAWTRTQNRRVLAEIRQLTQDAELVGCADALRRALAPQRDRETFLKAQIDGPGLADRWQALRLASTLPLAWRWRKLLYFSRPEFAAAAAWVRRLKARRRGV